MSEISDTMEYTYMKNLDMLFKRNDMIPRKNSFCQKRIIFRNTKTEFNGDIIRNIIGFIKYIHNKYPAQKIPIEFHLGNIYVADKLTYIIFECICYYLIYNCGHHVEIYLKPEEDILTYGINSSALKLLNSTDKENIRKFQKKFRQEIHMNHFRKLISGQDKQTTNYVGNLMQDIDNFLKFFGILEEYRDQITEVIGELVGNACEHGNTDCLLDIDVSPDHAKLEDGEQLDGKFYGINIAILDFSEELLGTGISEKIQTKNFGSERYEALDRALEFHKNYFNEDYTYEDFCNIAALQDKISGRQEYNLQGGTGLTKLIYALQSKSDMDKCYVLSGEHCVLFQKDLLQYDEQRWLGFNAESDFFNHLPDLSVFSRCQIFFPGTAYNLNFVMRREDD